MALREISPHSPLAPVVTGAGAGEMFAGET